MVASQSVVKEQDSDPYLQPGPDTPPMDAPDSCVESHLETCLVDAQEVDLEAYLDTPLVDAPEVDLETHLDTPLVDTQQLDVVVELDTGLGTPPVMGEGCELPLDFDIGAAVHCQDGQCGKLQHVVMHPSTGKVTHLIVRRGFLLKQRSWIVPVAMVERAVSEGIWLSFSSEELQRCVDYREEAYRGPALGWNHTRYRRHDVKYALSPYEELHEHEVVPADSYAFSDYNPLGFQSIKPGVKLRDVRGVLGEIDHVLVDCHEGHLTHVVVRPGRFRDYRIVPIAYVAGVDKDGVLMIGWRGNLDELPAYRPEA